MGADLDYLTIVVVWGRAKEDAMLMVRETETKKWQVTISQGSSKVEYFSAKIARIFGQFAY